MARIINAASALDDAFAVISSGGLAALPTETVYGLAADATNGEAVARIFEAKGRPRFNPLIAHVSNLEMAERIGKFDPLTLTLVKAFWPGPLTVVVPHKQASGIHPLVTAGLDTIALRHPRGFVAQLIERLGHPIAAPSANSSGRISATTAQAVNADLGERIGLIVDDGQTMVGLESTIIKVEGGTVKLLRPGGVPASDASMPGAWLNVAEVLPGEALLAFGPVRARGAGNAVDMRNLSATGDLREAAVNLFDFLGFLDASGPASIAVEPIPMNGLGEAINDRLSRAAAPRDMPMIGNR